MFSKEEQRRIVKDLKSGKISELPKGFTWEGGDLDLRNCDLKSLPEGFSFSGNSLDLHDNQLTSLPTGFSFSGNDLYLYRNQLTSLPKGFSFSGNDLYLGGNQLTRLPEGFSFIGNDLYLHINQLTSLPEGFSFSGNDLYLYRNQLTSLPEGFSFSGKNLYLRDNQLTSLPKGFSFSGNNLYLRDNQLTDLPEGFSFSGNDLDLSVNRLTDLPEGFSFSGNYLDLSGNQLTCLPEGFSFRGNILYLQENRLTSLPNVMTTTNPCGVKVYIEDSGLSLDLIQRIQRENLYPGFRFQFDIDDSDSDYDEEDEEVISINNILTYFSIELTSLDIYNEYQKDIIHKFLSKLLHTKEYENLNTRDSLIGRVQCLFSGVVEEDIFDEISNGMTSCRDRVILSFDNIESALRVKTFLEEHEYRAYAKSLMYLGEVDKIAFTYASTLRCCDTIEVILAFRTELAKRFDLRVSTQMFHREVAFVTDEEIHRLADSIGEPDIEAFMSSWDPYQKFLRKKSVISFDDLPKEIILNGDRQCSITGDTTKTSIVYNERIYDYNSFVKVFVDSGLDPFDRSTIDFSKVYRI